MATPAPILQQHNALSLLQAREDLFLARICVPLLPSVLALNWPSSRVEELSAAGWDVPPAGLDADKQQELRASLVQHRFHPAHRPFVAAVSSTTLTPAQIRDILHTPSPSAVNLSSLELLLLNGRQLYSVLKEAGLAAERRLANLEQTAAAGGLAEAEEEERQLLVGEGVNFVWVEVYSEALLRPATPLAVGLFHFFTTSDPNSPAPALPTFPGSLERLQAYARNRRLQLGWSYDTFFLPHVSWRVLRGRALVETMIEALATSNTYTTAISYLSVSALRHLFSPVAEPSLLTLWSSLGGTATFFHLLDRAAAQLASPVFLDVTTVLALSFSSDNPLFLPFEPTTDAEARAGFRRNGKRLAKELGWLRKVQEGKEFGPSAFASFVETRQWVPNRDAAIPGSRTLLVERLTVAVQLRGIREVLKSGVWCAGFGKADVVASPALVFLLDLTVFYRLSTSPSPPPGLVLVTSLSEYILEPLRNLLADLLPPPLLGNSSIPALSLEETFSAVHEPGAFTPGVLKMLGNKKRGWSSACREKWLLSEAAVERVRQLHADVLQHRPKLQASTLLAALLLVEPSDHLPPAVTALLDSLPPPSLSDPASSSSSTSSPSSPASASAASATAARPFHPPPDCARSRTLLLHFPYWRLLLSTHLPDSIHLPSANFEDAFERLDQLMEQLKEVVAEHVAPHAFAGRVKLAWEGWLSKVGEEAAREKAQEEVLEQERVVREQEQERQRGRRIEREREKENDHTFSPSSPTSPLSRILHRRTDFNPLSTSSSSSVSRPPFSHLSLNSGSSADSNLSPATAPSNGLLSSSGFSDPFSAQAARHPPSAAAGKGKGVARLNEPDQREDEDEELNTENTEDEGDEAIPQARAARRKRGLPDEEDEAGGVGTEDEADEGEGEDKEDEPGAGGQQQQQHQPQQKKKKKKRRRTKAATSLLPPLLDHPAGPAFDAAVNGFYLASASLAARQARAWMYPVAAILPLFFNWYLRQPTLLHPSDPDEFLPSSTADRLSLLRRSAYRTSRWMAWFLADKEEHPPILSKKIDLAPPPHPVSPLDGAAVSEALNSHLRALLQQQEKDLPEPVRRWMRFCERAAGAGTRRGYFGRNQRRLNAVMAARDVEDDLGDVEDDLRDGGEQEVEEEPEEEEEEETADEDELEL